MSSTSPGDDRVRGKVSRPEPRARIRAKLLTENVNVAKAYDVIKAAAGFPTSRHRLTF